MQIDIMWMRPPGPGRSGNCRPVDVFAPPPLPIQVINITDSDTVSITRVSDEAQDVTFSARSASQYFSDSTIHVSAQVPHLPCGVMLTCS